jgi:hypothetical protein
MPPDDPTPLGDAMTHRFPDQKIPEPNADDSSRAGGHGAHRVPDGDPSEDIENRPPLPDHPQRMAADVQNDEVEPALDSGPGFTHAIKPPRGQRG